MNRRTVPGWWPFAAGAALALAALGFTALRADLAVVRGDVADNRERIGALRREVSSLRSSAQFRLPTRVLRLWGVGGSEGELHDAGVRQWSSRLWPNGSPSWPPARTAADAGAPEPRRAIRRARGSRGAPDYRLFD
ncbi:MAG: hypothetical protein IT379_40900 [Deltaproteobacteria bacterium]|nr:hypothetical protein [Deltaproteobacteria bacterium]